MHLDPKQELKALDKRIVKIAIIDMPATVLIALGLLGKLGDNPKSLHPLLGNEDFTTGILFLGGIVAAWCTMQIISIGRRRKQLQNAINSTGAGQ